MRMREMTKSLLSALLVFTLLIGAAMPAFAASSAWLTLTQEIEEIDEKEYEVFDVIHVTAEKKNAYIYVSVKKQPHFLTKQYPMSKIGVRFTIIDGPEDSKRIGKSTTVKTGSYWVWPDDGEKTGKIKLDKPGDYMIRVEYRSGTDRFEAGDPGVAWRIDKTKKCSTAYASIERKELKK